MNLLLGVFAFVLFMVPTPQDATRRIHDLANILVAENIQQLETLAETVERETTAQLTVVTVPTLEGQSIDLYANMLFNQWGIGQQATNNGVLLLVAPNDRQVRIEVGRGLEPLLTDELCGELLDEFVIPSSKPARCAKGSPAALNSSPISCVAILKLHEASKARHLSLFVRRDEMP